MLIKQANVGLKFFRSPFLEKHNLVVYHSQYEPAIFKGLYSPQINIVLNHKAFAVIYWCGSDALQLTRNKNLILELKKRTNFKHIATSSFIEASLSKAGLEFIRLPLTDLPMDQFTPSKLGDMVYTYSGRSNSGKFYGEPTVRILQRRMPWIRFKIFYKDSVQREQLSEVYKKCFMGLRLVPHDGLSHTVVELGLMGRRVIWNGNSPNAISYQPGNIEQLIRLINHEQHRAQTSIKPDYELAQKMQQFINVPNDWLNTDYYEQD